MIIAFVSVFASIGFPPSQHSNQPPWAFFGVFGIVWLFAFGGGITNIILGIVYGIKANKGEWAEYPLIGGWILKKIVFN